LAGIRFCTALRRSSPSSSRASPTVDAKPVVAASFLLGALAIMALTLKLPLAALLATIALVGIGTSGTQMLIYGSVANYFPGVAWCAGFGRLGGVGGRLIAAGLSIATIFFVLAGLALVGVLLTVPASKAAATQGLAVAN
jgi:AAHS family benzoate transporter-like MFS transporter